MHCRAGSWLSPLLFGLLDAAYAILVHKDTRDLGHALLSEEGDEVLARSTLVAFDIDGVALTFRQHRKRFQKLLSSRQEGFLLLASGDLFQVTASSPSRAT
ncbi:hypothetical protein [Bradyrhizobium sp. DASA03007]|uniref:hypothetical protein n=1 Tax=unclassified Bradyrhizobium TaxID=2631580 RepID=UPI003F705A8C